MSNSNLMCFFTSVFTMTKKKRNKIHTNLFKCMQDPYAENYKAQVKEI